MNEYIVTNGDNKTTIIIEDNKSIINGLECEHELIQLNENNYLLKLNQKIYQVTVQKTSPSVFTIYTDGSNFELTVRSALQEKAMRQLEMASAIQSRATTIKAPMPGMILKIKKKVGEPIANGESILILEAMKMENDIHSTAAGTIKTIFVTEGNAVEKGAVLITIE